MGINLYHWDEYDRLPYPIVQIAYVHLLTLTSHFVDSGYDATNCHTAYLILEPVQSVFRKLQIL